MKFEIPADADDADEMAADLGDIATAAEFKRSALVYARVRVRADGGRPQKRSKVDVSDDGKVSTTEYARLQIHGLRSKTTIIRYWNVWDKLVSEGMVDPAALGEEVDIPEDAEWNTYYLPAADSDIPPEPEVIPEDKPRKEKKPAWANKEQSDKAAGMPQGDCPPKTQDVPEDESGFTDVNLPKEDFEEEESSGSTFNRTLFRFHINSTQRDIVNVNECLADMEEDDELPEGTKESIDSIIESWTDIKNAVSKKKEEKEKESQE